ncbi:MAG: GyrI-like domain-containing protein [Chloroflexota bacterium]|nr:GyrI-like domain-containing protein [Chloroflexota bacterium]
MDDTNNRSDPRMVDLAPQPTVAARVQESFDELDIGALFELHLANVADRIADLGGTPAGPPYARYHEFGPERVDVEFGIPVASPVANLRPLAECEPGEVGSGELPGGPAAVTLHMGSYPGLGAAYERLREWIPAQGHAPGGAPWESYINDPTEVGDADLRTEVIWPVS